MSQILRAFHRNKLEQIGKQWWFCHPLANLVFDTFKKSQPMEKSYLCPLLNHPLSLPSLHFTQ
jgi:hypothetical protein